MRINQFIARSTGLSRRAADQAVAEGKVTVNRQLATPGIKIAGSDVVVMDGRILALPARTTTILLNKPAGYVCSRDGQGSRTIYELLPEDLQDLKSVGRLDKDSSGLLLMTNDGGLANRLTHPSYTKEKVYEVELDKPLSVEDETKAGQGVELDDGTSKLGLSNITGKSLVVTMSEGRNRQIRRTFEALGYRVARLHRVRFGPYHLDKLASKEWKQV